MPAHGERTAPCVPGRPAARLLLALGVLCVQTAALSRADEAAGSTAPARALVYGEYPAGDVRVLDGDTLGLPGGEPSVRVLGLDCEEVFKTARDREAAAADFAAYAREKRGGDPRPVKYATPAGEAARDFVRGLFAAAGRVRLERDEVGGRELGTYGRRLAHVVLLTPGGEVNLAEVVIRQGHSPYFVKYGRSLRHDARFRAAEGEAREARRGIWSADGPEHYPDYAERLAWWAQRADQVERWLREASAPDRITLGRPDAERKMRARLGTRVVVFGLYERELQTSTEDLRVLLLGHARGRALALAIFEPGVGASLDMRAIGSLYVRAEGVLTLYNGRPQIVIDRSTQISTR